MRILVTGGTGFTGKALVKRLLDDGHQVVALDYKEGLKTDELRSWGAEVVIGSVTDRDVVRRCMKGVEVVQHLAAAFRELNVPEQPLLGRQRRRHAHLPRGGEGRRRAQVHLLQHLRRARRREEPADRRGAQHRAGGLLPADQVRGRAGRRGVRAAGPGDGHPAARRDLRPGRPGALLHDLPARGQGDASRCSAAAGRSTTRSTSTTWSTPTCWRWRRARATGRST